MKTTFFLSILGLAATALAGPLPGTEGEALDKRTCPNGAVMACQNACDSVVANGCSGCNGNPSCLVACQTARRNACINCCYTNCSTC
ncbi:hypothetical protein NEMBOFW57_009332 [Staphylotrichum longicolle]|uniref:Uncharacterized protein n=1 Tax=Staphylotrichum longicolle TaxID=669026 RepID=A0AAD4ESV7_9PEZI|nr:hypothetical protein NEMBOFW57_009332 [Staphylotrichum longicolle]